MHWLVGAPIEAREADFVADLELKWLCDPG
jgi:hypothetical protein